MPVNKSLAKALVKRYGKEKGKKIYYGMESDKKSSFLKALKTAKRKKHVIKKFPK